MPPYWFEKDMASILLIDALASETEESDSAFHDIFGSLSGAELTEAIPHVFRNYGIDIEKFLPLDLVSDMIKVVDRAWAGSLTVKQLAEYSDQAATRLALMLIGHGVAPDDDGDVADYIERHGVEAHHSLRGENFESPYDQAYDALNVLQAAILDSDFSLTPKERLRLGRLRSELGTFERILADLDPAVDFGEYQEFSKKAETVQRKINVLIRRK